MTPEGDVSRMTDRRMALALAREWDRLVDEVRTLDGFEDFLRPPRRAVVIRASNYRWPIRRLRLWTADVDGGCVCGGVRGSALDLVRRQQKAHEVQLW
jgi:hypothetical protein